MVFAEFRAHCKPLFKKLNIMPLPSLYLYRTLIEIHKNKDRFLNHSNLHNYPTRSSHQIVLPFRRLSKSTKNSLNLNLYNHLPRDWTMLTLNNFKKRIKNLILQNCYYCLQEFLDTPMK